MSKKKNISTRKPPNVETTPMQQQAVDNILSGKFSSKKKALVAAGYTPHSARHPNSLLHTPGVKKYISMLDKASRQILGGGIEQEVIDNYVKGLKATKLFGKEAVEHPDWMARKAYGDRIASLIGIINETPQVQNQNQYNFFMVKPEEREEFNSAFAKFVKDYYRK